MPLFIEKKWRTGQVLPITYLKDRATQLFIKYKREALVTQLQSNNITYPQISNITNIFINFSNLWLLFTLYLYICSVNDLRGCTFRCRIAISERGGHIVAVFREETPSLKIARVAVMEMGNLQLQSMTSLHNFLFKSDAQLFSLLTPHSKSFRFHCHAPGYIQFATTQTF